MASLKNLAQLYRNLSEAHDAVSEVARREADRAKQRALEGLSNRMRDRLVEALGEATSDAERLDAVKQLHAEAERALADLGGAAGAAGAPLAGSPAHTDSVLLKDLLGHLADVLIHETMRDTYRDIAAAFE